MQLTNGLYLVSTIATGPWGERWVQRNGAEDKSLGPKRVAVQPAGVTPFQWTVEQAAGGEADQFLLSASHGTGRSARWTIESSGELFATLVDSPPPEVWTVRQCERCEEGIFTVTSGDGKLWQTPDPAAEDSQIEVNNVIMTLIFPPQYPDTVLFNFTQLLL